MAPTAWARLPTRGPPCPARHTGWAAAASAGEEIVVAGAGLGGETQPRRAPGRMPHRASAIRQLVGQRLFMPDAPPVVLAPSR